MKQVTGINRIIIIHFQLFPHNTLYGYFSPISRYTSNSVVQMLSQHFIQISPEFSHYKECFREQVSLYLWIHAIIVVGFIPEGRII